MQLKRFHLAGNNAQHKNKLQMRKLLSKLLQYPFSQWKLYYLWELFYLLKFRKNDVLVVPLPTLLIHYCWLFGNWINRKKWVDGDVNLPGFWVDEDVNLPVFYLRESSFIPKIHKILFIPYLLSFWLTRTSTFRVFWLTGTSTLRFFNLRHLRNLREF